MNESVSDLTWQNFALVLGNGMGEFDVIRSHMFSFMSFCIVSGSYNYSYTYSKSYTDRLS